MKPVLLLALVAALQATPHSYVPPEGFLKDERVAVAVGDAILRSIYGDDAIRRQSPLTASLRGQTWIVRGRLPRNRLGGVAEIHLSKQSGEVIRVTHGR